MARTVLEVAILADPRSLEQGLGRAGKATDKFGKQAEHASKRATVGFKSIGTAAKLAGGALLGSAVISGLKDVASAAAEAEVSQKKMATQLKASGISFRAHAKEIDKVIQKHSQLSGLDDEDLQDAFTNIVRVTGNVTQSMKLTGVAADIARAKHIDVAKAGQLLGKVADGNTGSLKKLGVSFAPVTMAQDKLKQSGEKFTKQQMEQAKASDKVKTTAGALAAVQRTFAGQAKAYGETSAGSFERLGVASENLKETIGKALAPAMAGAAAGLTKFINEVQSGEGAGGKFAAAMGDVADEAKRVYTQVKPVVASIVKFVGENPNILKAAGALVAVSLAVKAIRFAGAISGLSSFLSLAAKAGRGPGLTIGGKMVSGIRSALTTSASTLKTVLTSVLSRAGSGAGATAADRTATSLADGLRSGENNGKFRASGGVAGRIFGRAITAGALVAVVGIGVAIAAKLNAEVTNALGLGGTGKGANANGYSTRPGDGSQDLQKTVGGWLKGLFGRKGGRMTGGGFQRYQGGGMVPAFVSPGEMIVHGGQASVVPGARVAADSVFTRLPVGAAVLTDHGQSLMAGGASLNQAVAMQAPHFAKGGKVKLGEQYLGDARTAGFTEALEGTNSRETFRSIIGGSIGTRIKAKPKAPKFRSSTTKSSSQAGLPDAVVAMQNFASREASKGYPYVYGGGHATLRGPSDGGYDCSGFVSSILAAGGYTSGLGSTDQLKGFGMPGDGRYVTVGVRGSSGHLAHTMINVAGRFFESGGGGNGAHARGGWNGNFPIHRHPGNLRSGGAVAANGQIMNSRGTVNPDPSVFGWGFRKGGTVAAVLDAGATDKSGVTAAFLSLTRRLADGTRSTFTYLSQLIRSALTGAKAAREAKDKVGARRYDSIADVARYEQGRRLAAPLLRLGRVGTSLERQEGRFASRQGIAGLDGSSVAGIVASITRGENSLGQLQGQVPGLKRALSQAKKTKNTKAIAEITKSIADLDDTILSRQASLAEQGRALEAQKLTDAENSRLFAEAVKAKLLADKYDPFSARQSAGSLALLRAQVDTPGSTADDLAALNDSLQAATDGYNAAVAANDSDQITQFGGDILSLRQSIEGMAANVADNTAAVEAQNALLQQQTDFAQRALAISQSETGTIGRAFASLISGELGGNVGLGLMTPGYAGGMARY